MPTADLTRPAIAWPRHARLIAPLVLLGVIGLQIAATRSYSLVGRQFWLDEIHTQLLVQDPSLSHAMEALKNGADTNAPGLYLLARAVSWAVGSSGPNVLRGIGLVSVFLGLVGIYEAVRRVYSPGVAVIAAMAAWAHPLITRHAFEARFYGPWFAAIVWLAYGLNWWDQSRRKAWPALLIVSSSVLVCTVHYLGILSLALVVGAHTLFVRRPWRESLARLVPVGFGVLALAACLPLYRGQRHSLSVPTWIEPPSLSTVRGLLQQVFFYHLFVIPVIGFFASNLMGWGRSTGLPEEQDEEFSGLAGLASLALMPAALTVFSFAFQTVLIDRYSIVSMAAFGPLIAPVVARTHRAARWAVLIGFVALSTLNLDATSRWFRMAEARRREAIAEVSKLADVPILFRGRSDLYELWWDMPSARDRLFYWDPAELGSQVTAFDLLERDMAKNHERWYGLSRTESLASLRDHPVVYLYGIDPKVALEIERSDAGRRLRPVDAKRGLFEASRTTDRLTELE